MCVHHCSTFLHNIYSTWMKTRNVINDIFSQSPFYFLNDTFPRRKCFASLYVMLGGVGRFSLKPSLRHLGFFFSTEQLSGWNGIKKENCHDVNFDKSVICLLDTGRRTGVIPRATRLAPCCGQEMLSKVGVFIFFIFHVFWKLLHCCWPFQTGQNHSCCNLGWSTPN